MSYAQLGSTGGGGGAVTSVTGVSPITANGVSGVAQVGAVSIGLDNYSNQTATTVNATPNNTMTFALSALPAVYTFDLNYTAFDITDNAGAGFSIFGTIRTDGATAVLIGTPDKIINIEAATPMTASDANLVVSGNNAIFQVTGVAAKTIQWRCIAFITQVS